ncbi:MAG: bifunctional metallophosphatase/5'-nucleotidase [Vicinamibacterales bacterium]
MPRSASRRTQLATGFGLAAALACAAFVAGPGAASRPPVTIQILDVSDWHAQLDSLSVAGLGSVGGAATLAAYFEAERAANPNTLTFTAGDAYGASPPISGFFDEEPAVLAMRLMRFDADTFGNHNFDRGLAHLQSMIDLAAADPAAQPGQPFAYVSANLANLEGNLSGVAPYRIFEVAGVKIAAIGITNPEAPTLVRPGNFGPIVVTDPVPAANKARARARRDGAKVFVALTHLGVTSIDAATGAASGPLIDFANAVGGFDVIFGDHTDIEYSGLHNNALVVENRSKGRTYSRTTLQVDPGNGHIMDRSNAFVTPLSNAVTPDAEVAALVQSYRDLLAPILSILVGDSTVFIPRADACGNAAGRTCESLVGNVVADSMRAAYGADVAFVNSGGLRADLTCPTTDLPLDFCPPYTPPPFPITRGQVLGVLPFFNIATTLHVNGAELKTILDNGVSAMPSANGRFPQVSGLCFTYDISAPAGSRIVSGVLADASGTCTATPIDFTAGSVYSLVENDFTLAGGDGYPDFRSRAVTRDMLDQLVADYVAAHAPINPSIQGRITCVTTGATPCPVVTP